MARAPLELHDLLVRDAGEQLGRATRGVGKPILSTESGCTAVDLHHLIIALSQAILHAIKRVVR